MAHLLGGTDASTPLLKNFSLTRKFCKALLLCLALLCLVLALARPQWGSQDQKISQEGRDVLIALDISRSMLAEDCKPNRLECAKSKIKELLSHLTADRVSLLVFSSIAVVQCPFTRDLNAVHNFLDLIDAESISSGSTALDSALEKTLHAFENGSLSKQKIAVLFTDGEDFSGDLALIKKKAHEQNLHLFIMGVGTVEGAPIPLYDEKGVLQGHQKDSSGNVVITRLNESLLRDLIDKIGGAYVHLTTGDDDIVQLASYVKHFETEKFNDTTLEIKNEQYWAFAALSILLLCIEWIL